MRRFYDKAHKLDVLDFFKAQAVHPDAVPDAVFRCVGRTVWADIGKALALCALTLIHQTLFKVKEYKATFMKATSLYDERKCGCCHVSPHCRLDATLLICSLLGAPMAIANNILGRVQEQLLSVSVW